MRTLPAGGGLCPHCGYDNINGPMQQPDHALPCGKILNGRYVTGRELGQSGFFIIYIGFDLSLEKRVSIKEYYPAGEATRSAANKGVVFWDRAGNTQKIMAGLDGFLLEAQREIRLKDLQHIGTVLESFQENSTAYVVMEYIEGETLRSYLKRIKRSFSESECVRLFAPLIDDLEEMYRRGIIHRDIKPDNLIMQGNGKLVLLGLGAAKDLTERDGSKSDNLVLSESYAPIEQYRTNGSIGPWTDVYALCATIYTCVTRKIPPSAIDRLEGESVDMRSFTPRFAAVLKKGLAIEPQDRFQTMAELREALKWLMPVKLVNV